MMVFQGFFYVTVATVSKACPILSNEFAKYEDVHFCFLLLWLCPSQLVYDFIHYFVHVNFFCPCLRKVMIYCWFLLNKTEIYHFDKLHWFLQFRLNKFFKNYCFKAIFCIKTTVNMGQNLEGLIYPLLPESLCSLPVKRQVKVWQRLKLSPHVASDFHSTDITFNDSVAVISIRLGGIKESQENQGKRWVGQNGAAYGAG